MPALRLEFVCDGERDAVTLPQLVEGILGCEVATVRASHWQRLHRRGGSRYRRKLDYACRRCGPDVDGLVATVDTDREDRGVRLADLESGRSQVVSSVPFPIAIGEATPNGDAWLLDDSEAVKRGLSLDPQHKVPGVGNSCKADLDALRKEAGREEIESLTAIARLVRVETSRDPKATGLSQFADDVRARLGPLANSDNGS